MMVNTFPFCEESKLRDKVIWRCTSKKTNCKARIHMLGQNVVAVKGMHNHPPRALSLPARRQNARKQLDVSATIPPPLTTATSLEALALQGANIEWPNIPLLCLILTAFFKFHVMNYMNKFTDKTGSNKDNNLDELDVNSIEYRFVIYQRRKYKINI